MAYADDVHGPWTVYRPGVLDLEQTACRYHIASPDVHVLDEHRRIVLYFHGVTEAGQLSFSASSADGLGLRGRTHRARPLLLSRVPPRRRMVRHRQGARPERRRDSAAFGRWARPFRAGAGDPAEDAPRRGSQGRDHAAGVLQPGGGLSGAYPGFRHAPRRRLAALAGHPKPFARVGVGTDLDEVALVEQGGLRPRLSTTSSRIAGARSALIQSKPSCGCTSWRMLRRRVSMTYGRSTQHHTATVSICGAVAHLICTPTVARDRRCCRGTLRRATSRQPSCGCTTGRTRRSAGTRRCVCRRGNSSRLVHGVATATLHVAGGQVAEHREILRPDAVEAKRCSMASWRSRSQSMAAYRSFSLTSSSSQHVGQRIAQGVGVQAACGGELGGGGQHTGEDAERRHSIAQCVSGGRAGGRGRSWPAKALHGGDVAVGLPERRMSKASSDEGGDGEAALEQDAQSLRRGRSGPLGEVGQRRRFLTLPMLAGSDSRRRMAGAGEERLGTDSIYMTTEWCVCRIDDRHIDNHMSPHLT